MVNGMENGLTRSYDVAVVGAGMVGLTLAAALGGAGMRVALLDRAAPATVTDAGFDGRVSALAAGSRRILEGVQAWKELEPDAEPILDIRVSDGDSPLFLHYDSREVGEGPLGYIVENRLIRRALFARIAELEGVDLIAPTTLVHVDRDLARTRLELSDGRAFSTSLLVAADGRNSRLRRDAGIRVAEWSYPQIGIVCTVAHERPHRNVAHERFLPAGPFAILPMRDAPPDEMPMLGPHRSSIVWTERAELGPRLVGLEPDAFNAELARRFGDFLGRTQAVGPRWSYPLSVMHADRYIDERFALIGDAAHAIHPIAGQGLNLGIRDVAALAEVLVDAARLGLDIGSSTVLVRYQRWRRFDNVALTLVTDGLNRLFSNDLGPLKLIRDLGLAGVQRIGPLKQLFMRHAMGLVGELPRLARGEPL